MIKPPVSSDVRAINSSASFIAAASLLREACATVEIVAKACGHVLGGLQKLFEISRELRSLVEQQVQGRGWQTPSVCGQQPIK